MYIYIYALNTYGHGHIYTYIHTCTSKTVHTHEDIRKCTHTYIDFKDYTYAMNTYEHAHIHTFQNRYNDAVPNSESKSTCIHTYIHICIP